MIKLEMNNSMITAKVSAQQLFNCVAHVDKCNPAAKTALLAQAPFIKKIVIDVDTGDFRGVRVTYFGAPDEAGIALDSHTLASELSKLLILNCS